MYFILFINLIQKGMKKLFFAAIATVGLFSACSSSDDAIVENNSPVIENEGLMPINLSFGATKVQTRGTGTVGGGFKDYNGQVTDNFWEGQNVTVLMLEQGTLDLAKFEGEPIFNHDTLMAPTSVVSGIAYPKDDVVRYFPTQGAFDFWGYRLDGSEVEESLRQDNDSIKKSFVIDGSQDIMVAKAAPTDDDLDPDADIQKVQAYYATTHTDVLSKADANKRVFSAYSARAGVQPNLIFRHLLSRLQFHVIPGQQDATSIFIDSICIISKNTGDIIVAHKAENDAEVKRITWQDPVDSLWLKQRDTAPGTTAKDNLVKLTSVQPQGHLEDPADADTWIADTTRVGEALLVAPGMDKYQMVIMMHQITKLYHNPADHINPATGLPYTDEENVISTSYSYDSYKINNALDENKSYNVFITVYGLNDIKVSATLAPWQDGDPFDIHPEDEKFEE